WDFGDGTTTSTSAANFTHVYTLAGTNNVQLTVTGPVGTNALSRTNYVLVTNPPPQLVVSPPSLALGQLPIGSSSTQNFQVINSGGLTLTGSVTVAAPQGPFSIASGSPYSVGPGL